MPDIEPVSPDPNNLVLKYSPDEAKIAEVRAEHEPLLATIRTAIGAGGKCPTCGRDMRNGDFCGECLEAAMPDVEPLNAGLKTIVPLRTELEKGRVALKADALRFGRKVDAEAGRLNNLILDFERPIQGAKQAKQAMEKARAEEKVRKEEEAKAAAQKILDDAEAAVKKAQDDAREAAQKKLDDERAEFEAEQRKAREKAEAEQKDRDRQKAEIEAQAAKVKADLDALEREKREAAEKIDREKREAEIKAQAEKDAKARLDREQAERAEKAREAEIEATRQKRIQAEREEAERKAAEAARPDVVKINSFGSDLGLWASANWPKVTAGSRAAQFLSDASDELAAIAQRFQEFKFPKRGGK